MWVYGNLNTWYMQCRFISVKTKHNWMNVGEFSNLESKTFEQRFNRRQFHTEEKTWTRHSSWSLPIWWHLIWFIFDYHFGIRSDDSHKGHKENSQEISRQLHAICACLIQLIWKVYTPVAAQVQECARWQEYHYLSQRLIWQNFTHIYMYQPSYFGFAKRCIDKTWMHGEQWMDFSNCSHSTIPWKQDAVRLLITHSRDFSGI